MKRVAFWTERVVNEEDKIPRQVYCVLMIFFSLLLSIDSRIFLFFRFLPFYLQACLLERNLTKKGLDLDAHGWKDE